jgi:predicted ATPase/DNA-binding SARP family transcriptional activator/Tfp pilus assembly protein PilF
MMRKSTHMNTPDTPLLQIRLFGAFDASVAGQPLPPLRSRAEKWLLMLLALRPGHALSREWLAATLWPDSDTPLGLYNLRRCLTNLRKALGAQADLLLSPTPQTLCLDRMRVQVDVADFDTALAVGSLQTLEQATALYRGPLLQECTEEWALSARIQREQAYLAALETLAAEAASHHQPTTAVRYLRLTIAADPLREAAHNALMQALADCGDYAATTQVYRDLRLLLHRELNTAPSAETEALYRCLQKQAKQTVLPPPVASSVPPRRLPVPLTTLVGRESDIEDVVGWLTQGRLVTLLGAGGVGKTRLAIAAAEALAPDFADGVWFVELASLTDPALVVPAVARTLGVKEETGRPLVETLTAALAARSLLLILDNCEHLLDACAPLAETLLSRCPALRLLATSREALGLGGEHRYSTPSLALPPLAAVERSLGAAGYGEKDLAWLMEYGGMRLFVERARQVQPAFRLTAQNAASVLGVVEALDGIPLAIELAAARVRSLSVAEIQSRLHDRFRLLTGGSRGALPRQQTLRALIDWSYDLLTEREKRLFERLSVFLGGWSLEAAEFVCADQGRKNAEGVSAAGRDVSLIVAAEVLDVLTALVDKSLVVYEEGEDEGRYRLLETVRQYGREHLVESGEAATYRRWHRDFFLALTEEAGKNLMGPDQGQWLTRLETEHANLRQALTFCLEGSLEGSDCLEDGEEGESGLKLGAALQRFWQVRGHVSEGRECLTALLARPEAQEHTKARADALNGAGRLTQLQGDYASARSLYEKALAIMRELGDKQGIAASLINLGEVAWRQGDYVAARSLFEKSLELFKELGDQHGIADALVNLGNVVSKQGDHASARPLYEKCLEIRRGLGDRYGIAVALINLGEVAWRQRDYASARSLNEESLAIRRELGDRHGIADVLVHQARVASSQGDSASARSLYEESLEIFRTLGDRKGIADSITNLASVAWKRGDYAATRTLQEKSLEIYRELGDRHAIANAFHGLALVASTQGDFAATRSLEEECLEIYKELEDRRGIVNSFHSLGNLAFDLGDYASARPLYEKCLELFRELADRYGSANILINLGAVASTQDDYASARSRFEEGLEIFRELGDRQGIAHALEAFASLNAGENKHEKAARLWGAAERLNAEIGSPMMPSDQDELDRNVAKVRAALEEKDFAAAWEEGRTLTMEQAVEYAIESDISG